jgi:hypothetical protein
VFSSDFRADCGTGVISVSVRESGFTRFSRFRVILPPKVKNAQQSVQWMVWQLRVLQAFFWLLHFLHLRHFPTPSSPPLTQTVGRMPHSF